MKFSRRQFLAVAGTGALGGLAALLVRPNLAAFAAPAERAAGHKTVVVVMQRGAVDGLAMVPPHGDPELARARPTLAGKLGSGVIDLDGQFGLHAGLAALAPHFTAGRLAIVPAVGLTGASRSHFEAQDLLEQGGVASDTGWANRLLAHRAHGDATAVAVGNTLPRALAGTEPALVIERNGEIGVARKAGEHKRDQIIAAFNELYATGSDPFAVTARRALASAAHVEAALAAQPATVAIPPGPVGQAMMTAARLIRAQLGAELIVVDTGGWDTHVGEAQRLDRGLGQLGAAIAAFAAELGDRLADVTLVTVSEFGRTVRENGTNGTDHGTATMSLVLGGNVAGGRVIGSFPGLAEDQRFEGRDLAIATDTRDLLGDVLAGTLGLTPAELATIFPGRELRTLGVLRA
ncbi:MAG TPA: DUF1501 domain-containing protein [Kofleriaceae bacterium]|nr:DUF1501 domain-containing protein [Kofleriaceae bacterium]